MTLNPRTILIAGTLASIAAAWSGFLLGGGFQPADMGQGTLAARNEKAQAEGPATSMAPAARHKKFSPGLTVDSSVQGAAPDNMSSVSTSSSQMAPAVLRIDEDAAREAAKTSSLRRRAHGAVAEEIQPRYPLVMMDLPPAVLGAQEGLAAAVDRLREKFIADIGGDSQNPADPAYLERWTHGVASNDEQLRSAIGWEAYNTLLVAAHEAQKAAP